MTSAAEFDPGRDRAIAELAAEALELTRDPRETIDPQELLETAFNYVDKPLERIGRQALLKLAGSALRLGAGGEPTDAKIRDWITSRSLHHAIGSGPLPVTIQPHSWEAARLTAPGGFRIAALQTLEAMTVAWPPAAAARVWHPARQQTIDQVRHIAARALAGPTHIDPGVLLEITEWEDTREGGRIPEDLLADALGAYARLSATTVQPAIGEIVRSCAALNGMICPDAADYQIHSVADEAAAAIDGAGFAGGATPSLPQLVDALLGTLVAIPGPLGRVVRDPTRYESAGDCAIWPAAAMRIGLIVLWIDEHSSAPAS
jgi:hypothetical protein